MAQAREIHAGKQFFTRTEGDEDDGSHAISAELPMAQPVLLYLT